jgi:hypothetical protein
MRLNRRLFLFAMTLSFTTGTVPVLASPSKDVERLASNPGKLRPGQFAWDASLSDGGPISVEVDLIGQIAWVYRGKYLIGVSTISSGSAGHETPTGNFTVLQKSLIHKSNLYDDAPMPFMLRLTWDGVALHAGAIPGHPASHGCIRLPKAFARLLYDATRVGATVTVTGDTDAGSENESVDTTEVTAPNAGSSALHAVSLPYALDRR